MFSIFTSGSLDTGRVVGIGDSPFWKWNKISLCHYLFIESNSTSGSYSSLEMDPQEALKNAGAEQATIVGGARTKPSNYVPSTKEGAAE